MYKVFGKENCSGCDSAKKLLSERMIDYEYVDVSKPENRDALQFIQDEGHRAVPQIYKKVFGELLEVGDYHDLVDELNGVAK